MIRDRESKYSKKVVSFVLGSVFIVFVIITVISIVAFCFLYSSYKNNIIETAVSKLEMLSISTKATLDEIQSVSKTLPCKNLLINMTQ